MAEERKNEEYAAAASIQDCKKSTESTARITTFFLYYLGYSIRVRLAN